MRTPFLAALLLAPALALANGYSLTNLNPRDLALSGAGTGAQEGAYATFANPAALSRIQGLDVSLAGALIDNRTRWSPTTGIASPPAATRFKPGLPPALFVSYGDKVADRGWGVGLGMTCPYGGSVDYDPDWPGRSAIIMVDRRVCAGYLAGGIELTSQLRVGGGLIYYRTTERDLQGLDFLQSTGTAEIATAGGKLSYDLSAELVPFQDLPVTVGIDYKHKATQTLTGEVRFRGAPPAFGSSLTGLVDQAVEQRLTIPNALNVGVAIRPAPSLLLALGYSFDRYRVYDRDVFVGNVPLGSGQPLTVVIPRRKGNGNTYRLGAEYAPTGPGPWRLRAGFHRDMSGFRADLWAPSLPDGNASIFTLGGSYGLPSGLEVSLAFAYATYDKVTTPANGVVFPGSWSMRAAVYNLGLSYHWSPAPEPRARAR